MATNPNQNSASSRFQFPLRNLLIIMTAACILFGLLKWLLPTDVPVEVHIATYVVITVFSVYIGWFLYRSKRHPWQTPIEYVNVKIDAKWKRRIRSRFFFLPIAALTGVSLTFAPLMLFWCGQIEEWGIMEWIAVPLCFLVIYIVPGFYMRLAGEVIAELHKCDAQSNPD